MKHRDWWISGCCVSVRVRDGVKIMVRVRNRFRGWL